MSTPRRIVFSTLSSLVFLTSVSSGMEIAKAAQPALTGLTVSPGTLSPAFNPAITSYTVLVAPSVSGVSVLPVGAGNTITVSGAPSTDSGVAISTPSGQSTVIPILSSANGVSITYTISVVHNSGLVPTFSGKITADGVFTFSVTNFDSSFNWAVTSSVGAANIDSAGKVTVTGIPQGSAGTVNVTSSKSDYESRSATIASDIIPVVIKPGLTPVFSSPVSTSNGFTVNFTNYDSAFNLIVKTNVGTVTPGAANGSTIPLTVSGLSVGQSATVTISTSRSGYYGGSGSVTGNAILGAGLAPTFSSVTPSTSGFSFNVTNFEASHSYSVTTSAGTAAKGTPTGTNLPITISGLASGQSAIVTITSSKTGFATASSTVNGTANVGSALIPTFGTPSPTAAGFNFAITNFDSKYTCSASTSQGSVTLSASGAGTVTGLAAASSATVSVKCIRTGYLDGSAQITSNSQTGQALTPILGAVTSTPNGVTFQVSNFDPKYNWNTSASAGTASINATGLVTVSSVAPGTQFNVTVSTVRTGYTSGSATKSASTSIGAALNPILGTVNPTNDGFTVPVTNYDAGFTWSLTSSPGSAAIDQTGIITVSNVSPGSSANLTVKTSRTGYTSGSATTRGNALTHIAQPAASKSGPPVVQSTPIAKPSPKKSATLPKSTSTKKSSKKAIIITCVKGTITRRIVGFSPVCPAGYVRKG